MNSMLFMLAGYDTTATSLEWIVYELVLHPEVQDKVFEEIESEIGKVLERFINMIDIHIYEGWPSILWTVLAV